jgi:hypothetical protein
LPHPACCSAAALRRGPPLELVLDRVDLPLDLGQGHREPMALADGHKTGVDQLQQSLAMNFKIIKTGEGTLWPADIHAHPPSPLAYSIDLLTNPTVPAQEASDADGAAFNSRGA